MDLGWRRRRRDGIAMHGSGVGIHGERGGETHGGAWLMTSNQAHSRCRLGCLGGPGGLVWVRLSRIHIWHLRFEIPGDKMCAREAVRVRGRGRTGGGCDVCVWSGVGAIAPAPPPFPSPPLHVPYCNGLICPFLRCCWCESAREAGRRQGPGSDGRKAISEDRRQSRAPAITCWGVL